LDKAEARPLAQEVLTEWLRKPYDELRKSVDQTTKFEVRGASRRRYTVDVQVFWDTLPTPTHPDPALRVLVAIDGGGWSTFVPLCVSDLVEPRPTLARKALE
jgi:hypothetical protein